MCATWADGEADKTCEGLVRNCYSTFSSAADVDGRCERTFEDVGSDDGGGGGSGTKTRLYDSDSARTGLFIAFSTPTQHPPRARCIALPAARGDDHDAVCTISGPRPRIIDPPPCRCPHQRASRQSRNPPSTLFAQDLNNSPSTPPLHRPRRLPTPVVRAVRTAGGRRRPGGGPGARRAGTRTA